MQKIKPFGEAQELVEIYQTGFQLAFASDDLEQCHPWVLCKDFLTDVLWATHNTEEIEIYGFEYNPIEHPIIAMSPVKLLARNKEAYGGDFSRQIQHACKFINMVEKKLGFDLATIEQVKHGTSSSTWMFTLDKRWIHAPPMISMLGLYLRVGCHTGGASTVDTAIRYFKDTAEEAHQRACDDYDDDEWGDMDSDGDHESVMGNDLEYVRNSHAMRQIIMKQGLEIFKPKMEDNYPDGEDTHTVHENWGIVGARHHEPFLTLWDLSGLDVITNTTKLPAVVTTIEVKKS